MTDVAPESAAASSEDAPSLRALHQTLYSLWQFGGNALIAWMPTRFGIEVLTVPKIRLFGTKSAPRRVFSGDRMMGQQTFSEVADVFGIQPMELRLERPVGEGPDALPPALVEQVFSRFAVTKTDHRAVILLDIVGFSRFSPEEQASQLATLEFALNIAVEATREQGFSLDAVRSTTGDGFYVWNREKGLTADLNLFVALVMFMTYHSLLRRRVKVPSAVPTLRTAISIGSHYSYRQPDREGGAQDNEYIVGDVTISLARLMQSTSAEQIIIGDFQRPDERTGGVLSADGFVQRVSEQLASIKGLSILGNPLDRFAFYLTGPRQADGAFGIQKLRIVDKHSFEHYGYNAKLNIYLETGENYYCGLQHSDLAAAMGG